MGLQSAMTTALTGLQAAETTIDVVGNNIANSNTVGFKASEVLFATQFLQTQSIGSAPSDTNGGTNPRQIGLGVKVAEISPDFSQGTIEISSNPLDLAIQGDGFLLVQGTQGERLYTRNGQLGLNSANQITTANGNLLLGYGRIEGTFNLDTAQPRPIEIPLGGERVAEPTTEAVFQGVLNPTVQPGTQPGQIASEIIADGATERPDDTAFDSGQASIRSAPTITSGGGATASTTGNAPPINAGTYRYRITLLDTNGRESTASTEFETTVGAGEDTVDLSGLPTETGEWAGGVRIYRNDGAGGTDFRLVGGLSAANVAGSVTTFQDTLDNTSWSAVTDTLDTDTLENGNYSYYVTYYNTANGDESRPSDILSSYAVNDDNSSIRIDFSNLSAPATSQGFNKVRIYRNPAGSSGTFQLVDEVDAPGQVGFVASYVDNTPSASLQATTLDFDGRGGSRAGSGSLVTDLLIRQGQTHVPLFAEGTLAFTGEMGGSQISSQELQITSSTTVQELMDFIGQSFGLQTESGVVDTPLPGPPDFAIGGGQVTISNGSLIVTSNYGVQNSVSIPLTAFRLTPTGSTISSSLGINFSETLTANGPGTTSEFVVYDSLGSPLTVRLTTVLENATSNETIYRWYATSGDSQPNSPDLSTSVGNGLLVFDSRGNLTNPDNQQISLSRQLTASESPLPIDLDFSQVTSLAETNSSGDAVSSMNMTRQDGFPPGVLTDFIITESGLIQGQFSNGTQRTLGQVLMARFANSKGLQQVGNGLFAESVNSGSASTDPPGENGLGTITAGAVELSNTDIGQDLIEMILAQTQYQAGSRVISTAQELLDELLALQR